MFIERLIAFLILLLFRIQKLMYNLEYNYHYYFYFQTFYQIFRLHLKIICFHNFKTLGKLYLLNFKLNFMNFM